MYALIEDGQLVRTFDTLPHTWGNVSGVNLLNGLELMMLGIVPVADQRAPCPTEFHTYINDEVVVVDTAALRHASVVLLPTEVIRGILKARVSALRASKLNTGNTPLHSVDSIYRASWEHLNLIDAATEPELYDITTGW